MKALSIRQPWSYAVFHLGKTIENRGWRTDYQGRLLIHAGASFDSNGLLWLEEQGFVIPLNLPTGAYLGTVWLKGCRERTVAERYGRGNPWAFGPFCFELEDPTPFDRPIPGPGQRGLYDVELPKVDPPQLSLMEV